MQYENQFLILKDMHAINIIMCSSYECYLKNNREDHSLRRLNIMKINI